MVKKVSWEPPKSSEECCMKYEVVGHRRGLKCYRSYCVGFRLLNCDAVWSGSSLPKLQMSFLPHTYLLHGTDAFLTIFCDQCCVPVLHAAAGGSVLWQWMDGQWTLCLLPCSADLSAVMEFSSRMLQWLLHKEWVAMPSTVRLDAELHLCVGQLLLCGRSVWFSCCTVLTRNKSSDSGLIRRSVQTLFYVAVQSVCTKYLQ
jgi:hypothetical protein